MKKEAEQLLKELEDLQFRIYQFQSKLEDDLNYDASKLAGDSAFELDQAQFKMRDCIGKLKKS